MCVFEEGEIERGRACARVCVHVSVFVLVACIGELVCVCACVSEV
jgi:hypothetical protein